MFMNSAAGQALMEEYMKMYEEIVDSALGLSRSTLHGQTDIFSMRRNILLNFFLLVLKKKNRNAAIPAIDQFVIYSINAL